jgi:hypothetical protein
MGEISSAPNWLNIKTEYIDENLDKFLQYLHSESLKTGEKDAFFKTSTVLLRQRVSKLLDAQGTVPIYDNIPDVADSIKILMAFLLTAERDELYSRAYLCFLDNLVSLIPNRDTLGHPSKSYPEKMLRYWLDVVLSDNPGVSMFGWNDLFNLQPQVITFKIKECLKSIAADDKRNHRRFEYIGKGCLSFDGSMLNVAPCNLQELHSRQENMPPSVSIMDGHINLLSYRDEKLKQSRLNDIESVCRWENDFIDSMAAVRPQELRTYSAGTVVKGVVKSVAPGNIQFESIDKGYKTIQGKLKIGLNYLYYTETDFERNLRPEDVLEATYLGDGGFSLYDQFSDSLINKCAKPEKDTDILCVVAEINSGHWGRNGIRLWTELGFPAYCPFDEDLKVGELVWAKIESFGVDKFWRMANLSDIEPAEEEPFDVDIAKRDRIRDFVQQSEYVAHDETSESLFTIGVLKDMSRLLFRYQSILSLPSERFRVLCVARSLLALADDTESAGYVKFTSDYLKDIVAFAKATDEEDYAKVVSLNAGDKYAEGQQVVERIQIVEVLREFGKGGESELLSGIIHADSKSEQLRSIAKLVQSYNRIQNVLDNSMRSSLKRQITKLLSVESAFAGDDLEEEKGTYVGQEGKGVEFKTSFFIPPKNAIEQNQALTVFKVLCSFLNSDTEGVLYLGVGDDGYVRGLDSDIEYMEKKIPGSNYHGIDGYMRCIIDSAKKYFDLDVIAGMEFNAAYEGRAMKISVKPYQYGVVYLEIGQKRDAFQRVGSESFEMTEEMILQLMDKRKPVENSKAADIVRKLDTAMRDKKQVILHRYASSNSGTTADRDVEAFGFTSRNKEVWCYDLKDGKVKLFSIERMGDVQIMPDGWKHENEHKKGKIDIFHMTCASDAPLIHVTLRLNLRAKNLLVEEYPDSEKFVAEDKASEGSWILDTDLCGIQGVGRFYVGLADQIEIVEGEELKEYVRKWADEISGRVGLAEY